MTHLASGLTVVYDDVPSVGTTALAFFVGVGSRHELPAQWGHAHLLEHLVFKGAGSRDFRAVAKEMDRLGADVNAFTTRDYTCYYARVLNREAINAYRLLVDLISAPWLRAADLEREKNVVLEELRETRDDPDEVVDLLITEALYDDVAYTHDVLGTPETIQATTTESLTTFYRQHYRSSNMVFAVSGGFAPHLVDMVSQEFSGSSGQTQLPRSDPPPPVKISERRLDADWEQVRLALAVRAPGRYHPAYAATLVFASILGGQNSSRLWQRLREEEGLVYSVSAQYQPESNFGDLVISLALARENVVRAMRCVREEVEQLATNGPSEEELVHTRNALQTMWMMNQEAPDARVMRLGRYALDQVLPPSIDAVQEALSRVSAADVRDAAAVWMSRDEVARVVAGPAAWDLQWE
ncbi:MAG: pitrilysin family protein [Firmicutes bacterium]|nr:pitrilysin family protein [Bacillota bacterium]